MFLMNFKLFNSDTQWQMQSTNYRNLEKIQVFGLRYYVTERKYKKSQIYQKFALAICIPIYWGHTVFNKKKSRKTTQKNRPSKTFLNKGKGFTIRSATLSRLMWHFLPNFLIQAGVYPLDRESAEIFATPGIWCVETLSWILCLHNSITDSIRKPILAGHLLFCNHVTALVLSQFNRTIRPRHKPEKHKTLTMAVSSFRYAIGNFLHGISMRSLLLHSSNSLRKRVKSLDGIMK